ncbi:MAG: hypothetical protein AAF961_17840, partial [Planctomycetota bacterium]
MALLGDSDEAAGWRQYLLLAEIAELTSVGTRDVVSGRRATSRKALRRLTSPALSERQRVFLAAPPLVELRTQLERWATGPVDLELLAELIEGYEAAGAGRYGDAITELRLRLQWSEDPALRELAEHLNRNYRNANIRIALSEDLLNRLAPRQPMVQAPVRDRIAGADVRGRSHTSTELRLRLLPDPKVLRLGLEASGAVKSQTFSESWPARVRNSARMRYEARKLIVVNRHGMHIWPAEAEAEGRDRLVGVDSQFDPLPFVGAMVQEMAREQHRQKRPTALAQVKRKVANQARVRMDREADAKLEYLERQFEFAVLRPLEALALAAEPIDMHTTEQRAVVRLRVAKENQLAAFTPRPSAPSDSLASLQLHDSLLNNAARGLDLEGRR